MKVTAHMLVDQSLKVMHVFIQPLTSSDFTDLFPHSFRGEAAFIPL